MKKNFTIANTGEWSTDWEEITEYLRNQPVNLNIPIVAKNDTDYAISEANLPLYKLVFEHYKSNQLKNFSEDLGITDAVMQWRIKGRSQWKQQEIDKACEILGIADEDRELYFGKPAYEVSEELKELLKEHYGVRSVLKCSCELGINQTALRAKIRGAIRWGIYKDMICKILDIKDEDRERIFADELR